MNKLKKLDEKEIVFINQSWSEEERKKFSEFIKTRKKESASKEKNVKRDVKPKHDYV